MRRLLALAVAALATAGATARADTIRAHSSTLFLTRQDPYGGYGGQLDRVSPIFEIVSVTATDVSTAWAEEVEIALSTWGAVDVGDVRRFQNGAPETDRRVTGDVDTGYVKGELFGRRLVLRVGRQMIADGTARMVHLDGGHVRFRLPANFSLQGWAGSPVPPRFAARGGELMTGNHRANFATGGRLSWFLPGRLEVGTSYVLANDRGDMARHDAGADVRVNLPADVDLTGSVFWSLVEERMGEAQAAASWRPNRKLQLQAEYRHVEPDLFLPRTSILSVFTDEQRDEAGAAVHTELARFFAFDATYHTLFEVDRIGHRATARVTHSPRRNATYGLEGVLLTHPDDDGYVLGRLFGARRIRAFELTADVLGTFLDRTVNREDFSLAATGTVGWRFAPSWKVLLAGSGGRTPFLIRHFDVIAKLVYDQTYVTREVP